VLPRRPRLQRTRLVSQLGVVQLQRPAHGVALLVPNIALGTTTRAALPNPRPNQSRCGRTSNGFDRGALLCGGGPIQCAWRTNRSDNPAVGERDAAQAAQLIRALSEVRDKMISQMTWLEKHDRQLDAAALRRDVNEAQAHITRLHRRYLGGDVQASQPVRQAR